MMSANPPSSPRVALRHLLALAAKERDQHRSLVLVLTAFLTVFWLLAWLAHERAARSLSPLEIVPQVATWGLPALALLLGHRLVVEEYYGRTQRFLEALPLRRGQEALVKVSYGLSCLLLWAALVLGASLLLALGHQPLDGRFVALLALRLGAFVVFLWGFVFLFFCFGRLRLPLLALAALILVLVASRSETSLSAVGPLALIDPRTYVVERTQVPWRALGWSLGLAAAALASAFALIRLRDGSIMESLARPLSLREKAAIVTLLVGGFTGWATVERRKPSALPPLTTDQVLVGPGLKLAYFDQTLRPAAERLAALLGPALAELRPLLPMAVDLRVVHGADVLPERPQFAAFNPDGGLVARADFRVFLGGERFAAQEALATLLHYLVNAATDEAVSIEPRHWLLDGFTLRLAQQVMTQATNGDPPRRNLIEDAALAVAQVRGAPLPTPDDLRLFYRLTEEVGELAASALCASGWQYLAEIAGPTKVTALARAAFARRSRRDLRDAVELWRRPTERLFTDATGLPYADFLTGWQRWLRDRAARPDQARWLSVLPKITVDVGLSRDALDAVTVRGRLAAPAPAGLDCAVVHKLETWYDTAPSPDLFAEDKVPLAAGDTAFSLPLEGDYESGERVFFALECRTPEAPFGVRLHAARVTVP
jgi:hypothetical protein